MAHGKLRKKIVDTVISECKLDDYDNIFVNIKYSNRCQNDSCKSNSTKMIYYKAVFRREDYRNGCAVQINYCTVCHSYQLTEKDCNKFAVYTHNENNTVLKKCYVLDINNNIIEDLIWEKNKNHKQEQYETDTELDKSSENINKLATNKSQPVDKTDKKVTFLVKGSMGDCIKKEHTYYPVQAKAGMLMGEEHVDIIFNAFYCNDCNSFFIKDKTFNVLKNKGKLLCPVISRSQLNKRLSLENSNLPLHSKMNLAGYNVNSINDYDEKYRQEIISNTLQNNICSKEEIKKLLNFLINTHNNQDSMKKAVGKWKDDLRFIEHIELNEIIEVKRIVNIVDLEN